MQDKKKHQYDSAATTRTKSNQKLHFLFKKLLQKGLYYDTVLCSMCVRKFTVFFCACIVFCFFCVLSSHLYSELNAIVYYLKLSLFCIKRSRSHVLFEFFFFF